jgi:hypothetical protein
MKASITLTSVFGVPRARIRLTNGMQSADERSSAPRYELLTIDELDTLIFQAAGVKLRMKALLAKQRAKATP